MVEAREKLNLKKEFSEIKIKKQPKKELNKDLEKLKSYVNQLYEKQLKNE